MLKIQEEQVSATQVIPMNEMKPLQVGVIVDMTSAYEGCHVVRTSATDSFEVMNLTHPGKNKCWGANIRLKVRLLEKGEEVTVKFFNR